jgi:hypothetical protein
MRQSVLTRRYHLKNGDLGRSTPTGLTSHLLLFWMRPAKVQVACEQCDPKVLPAQRRLSLLQIPNSDEFRICGVDFADCDDFRVAFLTAGTRG